MTPVVQHTPVGEGAELVAPDAVLTVKIDAEHTDGSYEVFEVDAPRGPTTPPHRTPWSQAYYVLHGRMVVQVDDEAYDLGPGSAITIPPDALHTFTVLSPTAGFLVMSPSPAMGRFFAELSAAMTPGASLEQSMDDVTRVIERHSVTMDVP